MKYLILFLIIFGSCLSSQSQEWIPVFTKDIRPDNLSKSASIKFRFDTAAGSRSKAVFIYTQKKEEGGDVSVTCEDSSFEKQYSSRELKAVVKDMVTECLTQGLADDNPDKAVIADKVPVMLDYAAPEWYAAIQGKIHPGQEDKTQSNVKDLSYNDSLMANILLNCMVKVYRYDKIVMNGNRDTINKKHKQVIRIDMKDTVKAEYREVAYISVKNIKVQISDGFIYSFSFDIDTSVLSTELKKILRPHQSFSLRYNLRHNILSPGLIDDKPAVYLKKVHTQLRNSRSEYMFFPGEFFNYQSPIAAVNTVFTARDTIINYPGCGHGSKPDSIKLKEKSLYSILNLDVFGDLVGFFDNNKPNGLIQSELKANFYGFRRPWGQKISTRARFTMLNKGELFFRLSKLDNKNRFLNVLTDSIRNQPGRNDTAIKYVHGYRLLEYQNIYAGLRFNVAEIEFRGGSLAFTGEATFLRTPLRDTVFVAIEKQGRIDTILSPIDYGKTSLVLAPGIDLKIFGASFCDIDIKARLFFIHPLTERIQTSSSEYDEFYGNHTLQKITTTKLYNFGVQFTLNLNNEKSRRVIFRGDAYIDTKTRGNNFMQLQIGYSADLNKFISLNNPAKN